MRRGAGALLRCECCHKPAPRGLVQRSTDSKWVRVSCLPACDRRRSYPLDRQVMKAEAEASGSGSRTALKVSNDVRRVGTL